MGIFDAIEKVINEHGSAAILRERLALVKEQYDAQIAALTLDRDNLATERDVLKSQLQDAQRQIQQLERQLDALQVRDELDEGEISILKLLAEADVDLTSNNLIHRLGATRTKVEFYLKRLEDGHFIGSHHFYTGDPSTYYIAHAGREYLIRRGFA